MTKKGIYNAKAVLLTSVAISILLVASSIGYYLVYYIPARDKIKLEQDKIGLPTPTLTLTSTPITTSRPKATVSTPLPSATPTPTQKIAVFLTYSSQTFYCRSDGVDAIKSADSFLTKALTEYKTCVSQFSMLYASCTNSCAVNNPTDECRNLCKEKYDYKQCPAPNETTLQNLLSQYCK